METKAEQPKNKRLTSKGCGIESFAKAGKNKGQMQ